MEKRMGIIREAAALIGADENDLTEEQATKLLRSLVMNNNNLRIRKARANVDRIREERNE